MMSCYDGLLELYRVTGDPDYLKAVEMTVSDIIENEISGKGRRCLAKLASLPVNSRNYQIHR